MSNHRFSAKEQTINAIEAYGREEYKRGLNAGLNVAEKFLVWINPKISKADLKKWISKEIEDAKKREP
jgi:hypothetical protein